MKKKTFCAYAITALMMNTSLYAVEIIAHRGASYDAPENTLASMLLGVEQKADALELDVYITKDGKLVVAHDKDTSRTTGGKANIEFERSNLAELKDLDVGSWKAPKYAGEKIPVLEELLKKVPENVGLFIELKSKVKIVPEFERVLRASDKMKNSTVITFDYETAAEVKKRIPEVPVYWLIGQQKNKRTGEITPVNEEEAIRKTLDAKLDGLDLQNKIITKDFAKKIHDAGLKLYAWTVDDPDEAKRLVDLGVLGITTNRPAFIRDALKN